MSAFLAGYDRRITPRIQERFLITTLLLFAAAVRFINLGRPNELVFDEVYYADVS